MQIQKPVFGQTYVRCIFEFFEKGSHLLIGEAGYSATYTCDEKTIVGMFLDIFHELIYIRLYILDSSMHCRYGVTLAGRPDADAPFRAETVVSHAGGSSVVLSGQIAAEHKYLAHRQLGDSLGCDSSSHINLRYFST